MKNRQRRRQRAIAPRMNEQGQQDQQPQAKRWEQLKQRGQAKINELSAREAQILGQIQQLEEDLVEVKCAIANWQGGAEGGDIALKSYWAELAEEQKNAGSGDGKENEKPAGGAAQETINEDE